MITTATIWTSEFGNQRKSMCVDTVQIPPDAGAHRENWSLFHLHIQKLKALVGKGWTEREVSYWVYWAVNLNGEKLGVNAEAFPLFDGKPLNGK